MTNEHWDYTVYQAEIAARGNAYLEFRRCDDRDFTRNVERLVKHAFQNRAVRVYVTDREERLTEGTLGSYRFVRRECPEGSRFPSEGTWYLAECLEKPWDSAKKLDKNLVEND